MEAYSDFADVYDTFMDDTPYEEWAGFLAGLIEQYGISKPDGKNQGEASVLESEKNLVVDLGCGTGTLTEILHKLGYDMIGIDNSQEMLNIAMKKRELSESGVLYLWQDMRELDLYSTAGTFLSVCDSINYLLEEEEILDTFRLINNYLYPGGVFIFDFNTSYKYETVIGNETIAENRDECSFIWENFYDHKSGINEYDLTIFAKDQNEKGLFRKFTETHYQRGYTLEQIKRLIEKAGLSFVTALDGESHGEPVKTSERIYVVAKEQGKVKQ